MAEPRGVFVTGTDTNVGKTVVSACLAVAWQAAYWKPIQTGAAEDPGDSATVTTLAGLPPERVLAPAYVFQAPLSPQAAAAAEGKTIMPDTIACPATGHLLIVEGAGGVLVPLTPKALMIDLMQRLALPVVLVSRSTLGTINHTLLSLEALRARRIKVAGVVINGAPNLGNRRAIEEHGRVRVLAELPRVDPLDPAAVRDLAARIPSAPSVLS